MLGIRVTVPIACFRKGTAREFLETEQIPPPSTCYGFLLSLIGEPERTRHVGARVTCAAFEQPEISTVLRTVWRVKKLPLGTVGNTRPDYQQLLTNNDILIWLDSSEEEGSGPGLEQRVTNAVKHPSSIERFGGLSLGESTHLVDEVSFFESEAVRACRVFLERRCGRLTLPVWVDHVGAAHTRYVTGDLVEGPAIPPAKDAIPMVRPPGD